MDGKLQVEREVALLVLHTLKVTPNYSLPTLHAFKLPRTGVNLDLVITLPLCLNSCNSRNHCLHPKPTHD